jgi:hypothetical protein
VAITLDNRDDSQLIFEVLNGRRTPLTASDLLKNLLFMRLDNLPAATVLELYEKYWAPMDDDWWNALVGTGHTQRGRRDHMLSAWLTVRLNREVLVSRLYGEARSYLSQHEDPRAVLADISAFSKSYRKLFEDASIEGGLHHLSRVALAHKRLLHDFGIMTSLPILLFLQQEEGVSSADYERCVVILEGYVVRRAVLRWATRNYGQVFQQFLTGLIASDRTRPFADVLWNLIQTRDSYFWPKDQEIRDMFINVPVYGNGTISAGRLRVFLGAIDHYLEVRDKSGVRVNPSYDELTVEHLMPQTWATNWPIDEELADLEEARVTRNRLVQMFGNLTLLTQSLNSAVSNGDWSTKLHGTESSPGILSQTKLHITQEVVGETDWDEDRILARSERLANLFIAVWPTPLHEG